MVNKKYTARPGRKVTIEINRKKVRSPKSKVQSPKGLIESLRFDDYQARRKGGIYLNFYDFGQFTEDGGESWQEFDWVVSKTINTDGSGFVTGVEGLTLADWDALKDQIFTADKDDWKNIFRKLDYERAERYGIDLYLGKLSGYSGNQGIDMEKLFPVARSDSRHYINYFNSATLVSNSKWTEKGLKIPEKQTVEEFNLLTHSGFINLLTTTTFKNFKVTTEPDPDAPEQPFVIDASTDFYLVPMFTIEYAIDQTSSNELFLNLLYAPLERGFFIDGDGWNPPEWNYSPFTEVDLSYSGPATARTDYLINYFKTRVEARAYQEPTGATSPAGFPTSGDILAGLDSQQAFSTSVDSYAEIREGTFCMAAKKKGEWFYFWSAFDRRNFNSSTSFLARTQKFRLDID